jgi:hypothetical protein
MGRVSSDDNPRDLAEDEAALAAYASALAEAMTAALPVWAEVVVERRIVADRGVVTSSERAVARQAGREAAAAIGPRLREFLALDIDEQRTTPLTIVREAVPYPTAVLRDAGVPPVGRDADARRLAPDDEYDLAPMAFADLGPDVHDLGITWGAAKAHVHLRRRRAAE